MAVVPSMRMRQLILGTMVALTACRPNTAVAPPVEAVAGSAVRTASRAAAPSIPEEALGWFESRHCLRDSEPSETRLTLRVERGGVDVIFDDSYHEHGKIQLQASEREGRRVLHGTYEVGKALWMVDGYVIVQGPLVAPSTERRHYEDPELVAIGRRLTLSEQTQGLVLSLVPSRDTGAHSRLGSFECLVERVPAWRVARQEALLTKLTGSRSCEAATSCCRALRTSGSGANDDRSNDVCNSVPSLTPAFCRAWLASAVARHYRAGPRWVCIPKATGEQTCSLVEHPAKPRPISPECIAVDLGVPER